MKPAFLPVSLFLLAMLAVAAPAENLLDDPGFETLSPWAVSGNAGGQSWSARSGTNGVALYGWVTNGSGRVFQYVPISATGTYTFTMYLKAESGFVPTGLEVRVEGLNDLYSVVDSCVTNDIVNLPRDGFWHHIYATVTLTNTDTTQVRCGLYGGWTTNAGDPSALFVDDASLYTGTYTGSPALMNPGFDDATTNNWRGMYWAANPESHWNVYDWAFLSGSNGVAVQGWHTDALPLQTNILSQPLTGLSTGDYTFWTWMQRETDFDLSNAALRVEFWDESLTNKSQSDVVTNFAVPNDNFWHQYILTFAVTNPSTYEVRPRIEVQWQYSSNTGPRALKIDDCWFEAGSRDQPGVETGWGYHNELWGDGTVEMVPGTNVGPFVQFNPVTHTNTFYILAHSPTVAVYTNRGDSAEVGLRTAWWRPDPGEWVEDYTPATLVGSVVLDSGQFHGQPSSGSVTLDLWRVTPPYPVDTNGNYYTSEVITLYYSPYFRATNSKVQTAMQFLTWKRGSLTNDLGQTYADTYFGLDYEVSIAPLDVQPSMANGSFEQPAALNTGGWYKAGYCGTADWANHSGTSGVTFWSWDPGAALFYQDIATTGGAYEFSIWSRIQPGAHPNRLEARLEWYDTNGALVQVNRRSLVDEVTRSNHWTKVAVLGHCTSSDLDRVRCVVSGSFDAGTEPYNEGIMFDDADLAPSHTNLMNSGFELGNGGGGADIPYWYVQPGDLAGAEWWAARSGTNGFAFYCWDTNQNVYTTRVMQPVMATATGSYVFGAWVLRELNCQLSNLTFRLEWFGSDYSNKVQNDTTASFVVPPDDAWHYYAVTGTCNNTALQFIEVSIVATYGHTAAEDQSLKVDDTSLTYTNLASDTTDGIPNWWLQKYGLGLTNGVGAGDDDGDGFNNSEEYAADTIPTDSNSWFRGVYDVQISGGTMRLFTMDSTNSRYYSVFYKTNLLDTGPWIQYGDQIPGNADASGVELVTTNDAPMRFYRIGVNP